MTKFEPPRDPDTAELPNERRRRRLDRIVAALLTTWKIPLLSAVVLTLLVVAAFVILRSAFPTATTTFISRFQFTFPNADAGRYPNEARFTINELLDPAILDQVYNQLQLDGFGVGRDAFYASFSIRPYSPTAQEVAESYRQQLADRRLSFAERERLEQQLRNRLEQMSRGAGELSFTLTGRLVLPPEIGRAIVQSVPRIWSQVAIDKKGVLKIQGVSAEDNVISKQTVDRQPLPLAILSLIEANQRLDDRFLEMGKTPGMGTVRDTVSGKTLRDLEWRNREHQLFYINPLRAALATYSFPKSSGDLRAILQQRIAHLGILEADTTRQAQAVGDTISRFVDATAGLTRGLPERRGSDQPVAGGTTIQQVGEGFIDRMIELTRASIYAAQNQAFIAERTNAQFELNRRASEYRGEQNRWKELLANLPREDAAPQEPDESTRAHLVDQLRLAIDDTNANWAAMLRLEAEFASNRINRTAEIYVPFLATRDVVRFDPVFNLSSLATALSLVVIFCLGLWGLLTAFFLRRN